MKRKQTFILKSYQRSANVSFFFRTMAFNRSDILKGLFVNGIYPIHPEYYRHVADWLSSKVYPGFKSVCSKCVSSFIKMFCDYSRQKWMRWKSSIDKARLQKLLEDVFYDGKVYFPLYSSLSGCEICKKKEIHSEPSAGSSKRAHLSIKIDELYYLNADITDKFAEIVVKSIDGQEIRMNHLLLASLSNLFKIMLDESKCQANEIILYTDFSFENLKILQNFLSKGTLPCSKERSISSEISHLFYTFGIEWNSFNAVFKTPTIFVKNETVANAIKTDIPMTSEDEDEDEEKELVMDEKIEIKREPEEIILKIPKNEIIANDNDDSDISDEDIFHPELMIDARYIMIFQYYIQWGGTVFI